MEKTVQKTRHYHSILKIQFLDWIPLLLGVFAIGLGLLHTWAAVTSSSMNADGIAYLDIGDAVFQGNWQAMFNPVWSPLYPLLLGFVLFIFSPPMPWEFPTVQVINFGIYLFAFGCFLFFWRQLIDWIKQHEMEQGLSFPTWAWHGIGTSLFIWSSLALIEIWSVTPDMLTSGMVYLAAGLVIRIRSRRFSPATFLFLGIILGLGYLAKAIIFPVGLVLLIVGVISTQDLRKAPLYALVALLPFSLISLPFIYQISVQKGYPTLGEAGKLTYLRHVNGIVDPHWQGEEANFGSLAHPTRKISDHPPIYEFNGPIPGTYPITYDPSYWYEGSSSRFVLSDQVNALIKNSLVLFELLVRQLGGVLAVIIILYFLKHKNDHTRSRKIRLAEIFQQSGLGIVAAVAIGFYSLVLVEGRYVGTFLVLLFADGLAGIRLPHTPISRKIVDISSWVIVIFLLSNIAVFNLEGYFDLSNRTGQISSPGQSPGKPSWPGEVAEELHRLGIQPGDEVAIIGYGFDAFWARLARVRIVAEMLDWEAGDFWLGDNAFQSGVLEAFASTGAKAIVAENVPGYASLPGWHQVGSSNYFIFLLNP